MRGLSGRGKITECKTGEGDRRSVDSRPGKKSQKKKFTVHCVGREKWEIQERKSQGLRGNRSLPVLSSHPSSKYINSGKEQEVTRVVVDLGRAD